MFIAVSVHKVVIIKVYRFFN